MINSNDLTLHGSEISNNLLRILNAQMITEYHDEDDVKAYGGLHTHMIKGHILHYKIEREICCMNHLIQCIVVICLSSIVVRWMICKVMIHCNDAGGHAPLINIITKTWLMSHTIQYYQRSLWLPAVTQEQPGWGSVRSNH